MAEMNRLIPFILRWEGGYIEHKDDRGGATHRGVTLETYSQYREGRGLCKTTNLDLQMMTIGEWSYIFEILYWNRWLANKIRSQALANLLVDWVWMSGKWGIVLPQKILGVKEDGIVGRRTLRALNEASEGATAERCLYEWMWETRRRFYHEIVRFNPTQSVFLVGWLNRLEALRKDAFR